MSATRLALIVSAVLMAAACAASGGPDSSQPAPAAADQAGLRTLTSASDLMAEFDRDEGAVRLVLLFSPT